jgi:hypothetical protein
VTALPSSLRLSDPLSVSFDNGDKKWVKAYFGRLSFNGWRPGCSSADSSVSSYRVSIGGTYVRYSEESIVLGRWPINCGAFWLTVLDVSNWAGQALAAFVAWALGILPCPSSTRKNSK